MKIRNAAKKSLKTKLNVTVITFAVIPVIILSVFFIRQVDKNLISEQEQSITRQLNLLNNNINTFFDAMLDNVTYFAESKLLSSSDSSIKSYADTTISALMTPGKNGGVEATIFEMFSEFGNTHSSYQYVYMGTEQDLFYASR